MSFAELFAESNNHSPTSDAAVLSFLESSEGLGASAPEPSTDEDRKKLEVEARNSERAIKRDVFIGFALFAIVTGAALAAMSTISPSSPITKASSK